MARGTNCGVTMVILRDGTMGGQDTGGGSASRRYPSCEGTFKAGSMSDLRATVTRVGRGLSRVAGQAILAYVLSPPQDIPGLNEAQRDYRKTQGKIQIIVTELRRSFATALTAGEAQISTCVLDPEYAILRLVVWVRDSE